MEGRLTAILAADVVGYSCLMGADEEATLATLNAYRAVMVGHSSRVTMVAQRATSGSDHLRSLKCAVVGSQKSACLGDVSLMPSPRA